MIKLILILLIITFISTSCHGCSLIEKYTPKLKEPGPSEQVEEEKTMTDPIPVNPAHS